MEEINQFIITSSQEYMNQALSELSEYDQNLKVLQNLHTGIIIAAPSFSKAEFIERILRKKPVFIRHIHTVDAIIPIDENTTPEQIAEALNEYHNTLHEALKVGVQVRKGEGTFPFSPLDVKIAIDRKLQEDFAIAPETKTPQKIISIFLNKDKCYIGVGTPKENLSDWSGGMVHFKKDDNDISRAKFKLMEAIHVFELDMSNIHTALDLGAAPGGWSSVLLENGIEVTAVDTGEMDSRLSQNKKLHFIKQNADDLKLGNERFDILTSDISWNPIHTANMVKKASIYLSEGGIAIVTVKLMGSKVRKIIREVTDVYSEVFQIKGARQLFHNRDEITLYMEKKVQK